MEYCHQAGIPHSQFLDWDEHDQEAEIAYMLHSGERCHQCGTFPEDWLDDQGKHIEPIPYVPKTIRCLGCEQIQEAMQKIPEEVRSQVRVILTPNKEAQRRGRFGPHWGTGSS